jgi:hypothetical protein
LEPRLAGQCCGMTRPQDQDAQTASPEELLERDIDEDAMQQVTEGAGEALRYEYPPDRAQ